MRRFKSILVVCQEDSQPELAIEKARTLATQNGAKVTLVDVVNLREAEMADAISEASDGPAYDLKGQYLRYHEARLDKHRDALRKSGIETEHVVLWGVVFVEVIRAVIRNGHDLVIKATNPDRKFEGQPILGGLDMHLMRKCPCPVWIVKDGFDDEGIRVLAAVDPSSSGQERDELNRLIMDLSTSVCPEEAGRLDVVHAWALEEERALLSGHHDQVVPEEISKLKERMRALRAEALDQLISHYPEERDRISIHLLAGPAGDVVSDFAARERTDLVVMGTVSRTDIPGMFMGDTAEMILNRVGCSVLAVKPKTFKSPIELSDETEDSDAAAISARGNLRVA